MAVMQAGLLERVDRLFKLAVFQTTADLFDRRGSIGREILAHQRNMRIRRNLVGQKLEYLIRTGQIDENFYWCS